MAPSLRSFAPLALSHRCSRSQRARAAARAISRRRRALSEAARAGTALEAAEPPEGRGVRIRVREVPGEDRGALGGGATTRAGRADRIGRFELANVLDEVAYEAAALGGDEHVRRRADA